MENVGTLNGLFSADHTVLIMLASLEGVLLNGVI